MQILVNPAEVRQIVLDHIQANFGLDDSNDFIVELQDDGSVAIGVNESTAGEESNPTSTGEKPQKKSRRTKAQIEADNKAEEEAKQAAKAAASGNEAPTQTTSADPVKPTEPAPAEDAGEVIQTEEPAAGTEPETTVDPQPAEPTVAVEEQSAEEPEPAADPEPEVAKDPEPAPEERPRTQSLFANLRKPNNQ